MSSSHRTSSPLSVCFHPSAVDDDPSVPPPPPNQVTSGEANLTTSLYHTDIGVFSLTWSRTFLGHSLHLHTYLDSSPLSLSPLTFHLHVKAFTFWRNRGSKKISANPEIRVFWDLTRAKFGSTPEPVSGFYVAVAVAGEMGLLVGDSSKETYAKTRKIKQRPQRQVLVSRRENVLGNRVYATKARIRGKLRAICIDCKVDHDAKLCFSVDNKRVLQIKRLKWKFRGNGKIDVDGVTIQISWDVYNWLFGDKDKDKSNHGYAVFMFRYENPEFEEGEDKEEVRYRSGREVGVNRNGAVLSPQGRYAFQNGVVSCQQKSRTSSSSVSAVSSGCSSSVMEWANCTEEGKLGFGHNNGFSLLVYAWRK